MKQKIIPFLATILLLSCSNPDPSLKYQSYVDKFDGVVYRITDVEADVSGIRLLPEGVGSGEYNDLYHQFAEWNGSESWRAESWVDSWSGEGRIRVYFPISSIETDEMPPYTRETHATLCGGLVSWVQTARYQILDNGGIQWKEPIKEEDPNDLARTILGKLQVLSFDEEQLEVLIDEYPVFDQDSKKVLLIPINMHFVRGKN